MPMEANFRRAILAVLKHEGGYSDHPRDPGGATNRGITLQTLRSWRGKSATKADVQNLTEAEAILIYEANYWNRINGDNLPYGVDFAVFDFAVNSGVSRAAIYLQEIVGVAPDGKIGPLTLEAVHKWDSVKLVEKLCANRLAFLKRLSTWDAFGKGWSRRVSEVLHLAKDMAIAFPQQNTPSPSPTPPKRKTLMDWVRGWFIKRATDHITSKVSTHIKDNPTMFSFLDGYKTYIATGLLILVAVAQMIGIDTPVVPEGGEVQTIWAAIIALFMRQGISKV